MELSAGAAVIVSLVLVFVSAGSLVALTFRRMQIRQEKAYAKRAARE